MDFSPAHDYIHRLPSIMWEGLARLAGASSDLLRARFDADELFFEVVDDAVRRDWPDPTAPSLKDLLGEFSALECSAALLSFGDSPVSHDTAIESLRVGGHVLIRSLPIPQISAWKHGLADELCGGRSHQINATLSVSQTGAGVEWHHDAAQRLIVLQLKGEKTWWVTPGKGNLHPATRGHGHARLASNRLSREERDAFAAELDDNAQQLHMTPGAIALLPPYHWHRTRALSESWSLVFVVQRGGYADTEWKRLADDPGEPELWPEPQAFDADAVVAELDARWAELRHSLLDAGERTGPDPRSMYQVANGAVLRLTRTLGGYWSVKIIADGDTHEQLISKVFVPLLQWLGTRDQPFSGYLARAHGPSLPPSYTDRLLNVLCEKRFLTRLGAP